MAGHLLGSQLLRLHARPEQDRASQHFNRDGVGAHKASSLAVHVGNINRTQYVIKGKRTRCWEKVMVGEGRLPGDVEGHSAR